MRIHEDNDEIDKEPDVDDMTLEVGVLNSNPCDFAKSHVQPAGEIRKAEN